MIQNPINASNQWRSLSDRELEIAYLNACAENIRWLLDSYHFENNQLSIEGWALAMSGQPEQAQFLINGMPFKEAKYPIPSPDVGSFFWNIPAAQTARFACKTEADADILRAGFARLEFLAEGCDREQARRQAWYLPNPMEENAIPDEIRIRRVIGVPNITSYRIGGATVYKRFEDYLINKYGKKFSDFGEILDWGCGCGRIARYFHLAKETRLRGVDIDGDNLEWCQRYLPFAQFTQASLLPPLCLPDAAFDLIIGIAVMSQLNEEHQLAWLQELRRVAKKDSILMLAIPGLSQIGLSRPNPAILREIEEKGFVITGRNSDLDKVLPDQTYYISGLHSRDYLYEHWGKIFTIVEIVDALAANMDLVVLRNDAPQKAMIAGFPSPNEVKEKAPENPFALPLRDYDINPVIHPTIVKTGYGGHLADLDGKDYVDFLSAWGTNLLGYGYKAVARAAARQTKRFNSLGLPYPQFQELMALIRSLIPSAEEVRYGKNGSDACAGAVRLARHVTGREKILYRGYHGFHDWYFASTDCPGIPVALKSTIISQPELTPSAIDAAFRRYPGEIAGLILNPLTGPIPSADEMREVIEVIHRHGGLVIFDEMLSGFRVAFGGMQQVWGVRPDLSCFGKCIANGLPLSVLCGKSEYMRRISETYYGMTFEGEAVSIAAAHATLSEVVKKKVIDALYEKGRIIRAEYRRLAEIHQLSTSLVGYEPIMHLEFQSHGNLSGRQLHWLMVQELVRNGVFTLGAFILCYSHSRKDLQLLGKAMDAALSVVHTAVERGTTEGLLDERIRQRMEEVKGPAQWRRTDPDPE
jgi:glutamate-1-semialdehyde aminotransferase